MILIIFHAEPGIVFSLQWSLAISRFTYRGFAVSRNFLKCFFYSEFWLA